MDYLLAAALVVGAVGIGKMLGLVAPSRAKRLTWLREALGRADRAHLDGSYEEAHRLYTACVAYATKHFGETSHHAALAWHQLILVQLHLGDYAAMIEAAEHTIRCAAAQPGLARLGAEAREELARAHALLGAFEKVEMRLDEAEAIRRSLDPPSVAITLLMRARLAFWAGELPRSAELYARVVAAVDEVEPGAGAYRQRAAVVREPLELGPTYIEDALVGQARVLYFQSRDAEAKKAIGRLIERAARTMTIDGQSPAQRLHDCATRLAAFGLVDGPRELALAAADHAAPRSALSMRIEAAAWTWHAGDASGADTILRSLEHAAWDRQGRAQVHEALASQSFARGEHEEGENLLRAAREADPSFQAQRETEMERASSSFARGDTSEAIATVEAMLVGSPSVDERTLVGFWAFHRSIDALAERVATSPAEPGDGATRARVNRAVFLAWWAARHGDLGRASSLLEELEVPLRYRYLRSHALHNRGGLALLRGRSSEAHELLSTAWSLRARSMDARASLGLFATMAAAEDYRSERAETTDHRDMKRIAERLPPRDPSRRHWLHYEAARHEAAGDPESALRLCEETHDLDTFWFGTDGPYAASLALIRSKAFARLGRDAEALEQARRAVALERAKYPDHHPLVANAERQLATLVVGAERRSLLDHVLEVMRAHDADDTEEVERLRADA